MRVGVRDGKISRPKTATKVSRTVGSGSNRKRKPRWLQDLRAREEDKPINWGPEIETVEFSSFNINDRMELTLPIAAIVDHEVVSVEDLVREYIRNPSEVITKVQRSRRGVLFTLFSGEQCDVSVNELVEEARLRWHGLESVTS